MDWPSSQIGEDKSQSLLMAPASCTGYLNSFTCIKSHHEGGEEGLNNIEVLGLIKTPQINRKSGSKSKRRSDQDRIFKLSKHLLVASRDGMALAESPTIYGTPAYNTGP